MVGHFVGTNPEGFHSDPKKCVRIPSLRRHPVCAAAPSVCSDSHAMTNLFSMYEVRIICLWTWHHRLVNSCEATQAFGREAQRVFFPPSSLFALISALRNAIDQEILRDYHPPLFSLTDCMLLKFYPVCLSGLMFIGLRDWCYITFSTKLPHHGCALFLPLM